jgi:hypothetical protein
MLRLPIVVNAMVDGAEEVKMNRLAVRNLGLGANIRYESGNHWRAMCLKCQGVGKYVRPDAREDMANRGMICFACQGRGTFKFPRPERYVELQELWTLRAIHSPVYTNARLFHALDSEMYYMVQNYCSWYEKPYSYNKEVIKRLEDGITPTFSDRTISIFAQNYNDDGSYRHMEE